MSADVLALVDRTIRDYPGGEFEDFDVRDSRNGEVLATRSELSTANEIAIYLNSTYPSAATAPAPDSLVHEIICHRVAGERPEPLNRVVAGRDLSFAFPSMVPVGPGWDHLYSADESPGPDWYRRQV